MSDFGLASDVINLAQFESKNLHGTAVFVPKSYLCRPPSRKRGQPDA